MMMLNVLAVLALATCAFFFSKTNRLSVTFCSKCKGPMRVIALIEDPAVIRRILEHRGLWAPQAMQRSARLDPEAWPVNASLPLTYNPVPEIA